MKQYQVDRLEGRDLNRAVCLAEKRGFVNRYVEDVSIANTVITRERITTGPGVDGSWYALYEDAPQCHCVGPTPQIAALRARVKRFVNGAEFIAMAE